MPNRILKESICTSDNLTQLDWGAQLFFLRLTVQCDDFGRFDGRPAILRATCYPLELDRVTEQQIDYWLNALEVAELVQRYSVDGKRYLQIVTWSRHQQTRADKSKYPNPPAFASTCKHMQADASNGLQPLANVLVNGSVSENVIESENENGNGKEAAAPPVSPPPPSRHIDHEPLPEPELLRELHHAFQRGTGQALTNASPTGAAKAALRQLLDDQRPPGDIERCARYLKLGWWNDKALTIPQLADRIGQWVSDGRPAKPNGQGRDEPAFRRRKDGRRESTYTEEELEAARAADRKARRRESNWSPDRLAAGRAADEGQEWAPPPDEAQRISA